MEPEQLFTPRFEGIRPADFAGEYHFMHDGWPGILTLHAQSGRSIRGSYRDERYNQSFVVTGRVDPVVRHHVEFTIHDFNWLAAQHFDGYLFTKGRQAIAGVTWWKDEPFGFIARRSATAGTATYRAGDVEPEDFAGSYELCHDGWSATVDLEHRYGRRLVGRYRHEQLHRDLEIALEVDPAVRHQAALRFTGDLRLVSVRGMVHLFTRPKNAIAGVLTHPAGNTGIIMVRRAQP